MAPAPFAKGAGAALQTYMFRPCVTAVLLTAGGDQVPLIIDGDFSFGQYIRSINIATSMGPGIRLDLNPTLSLTPP